MDIGTAMTGLPKDAPLAMPEQCFRTRFNDPVAPACAVDRAWPFAAIAVFAAVLLLTGLAVREMVAILKPGGLTVLEIAIAVLFSLTFLGIAIGCVTAIYGAGVCLSAGRPSRRRRRERPEPVSVALLMLTYNEEPDAVFANVAAMARDLAGLQGRHWFSIYVLSDTTDRAIAAREAEAAAFTRHELARGPVPIHYRRREANTDRKVGNLRDWCTRWGGHHDGMIVLDADSLMSADAIVALSDALAEDPRAGLIQTVPAICEDQTLFARVQAFCGALTGQVFAHGLARWSGTDANYWGHNAIIRVSAFAAAAGLPRLSGRAPFGGLVMSHDFVEAALIR
ncbi:MAG: glucans biosynthesis glucosyltransferase MdoH, partial [Rhodobiaceae bacterium]|nr:glucans biosynthesis glucosyltransferase MdoH [Rhodobiaceae bacterium]